MQVGPSGLNCTEHCLNSQLAEFIYHLFIHTHTHTPQALSESRKDNDRESATHNRERV